MSRECYDFSQVYIFFGWQVRFTELFFLYFNLRIVNDLKCYNRMFIACNYICPDTSYNNCWQINKKTDDNMIIYNINIVMHYSCTCIIHIYNNISISGRSLGLKKLVLDLKFTTNVHLHIASYNHRRSRNMCAKFRMKFLRAYKVRLHGREIERANKIQ